MESIVVIVFAVIGLATSAGAADLPDAPSSVIEKNLSTVPVAMRVPAIAKGAIDRKFVGLGVISTGSTFADSYTTLFARQNWLGGKRGVCNAEVASPYLYGTHPTVGRTYAVATTKSAAALLAAYCLRKRHSKFWSLPLVANAAASVGGVTQNMIACN